MLFQSAILEFFMQISRLDDGIYHLVVNIIILRLEMYWLKDKSIKRDGEKRGMIKCKDQMESENEKILKNRGK